MIKHRSFIDKTTELLNTYHGAGSIYLFFADFADFKLVNYYYGMEKGNELLNAVVKFVRNIPEVAYCERVFSDQFLFIVLAKAQRSDEEIIASYNHFAEAFLSAQRPKYPACNLRFHCGIFPMKDRNVLEAIDNANMARLDAKRTGAPTAVLFTQSKLSELAARKEKEREITLALHENRFAFYLQPKVDLLTGQIIGAEALARRFTPEGALIYPDNFIPIMEQNGSIVDLDFSILEQVCQHMADRLRKGFPVVRTSVNLSRAHILNCEDLDKIHAVVEKYGIPPDLMEFELTENILLDDFEKARSFGDRLRAFGYKTSVDDFGSGYSGINIWQELSFDVLKLDRKFLSDDPILHSRNAAIIPSIIDIAQRLNIDVICEGVERADQCRCLLELGCRYAQGFYFSKAVPPDTFYQIYHDQHGHYPLSFHVQVEEVR